MTQKRRVPYYTFLFNSQMRKFRIFATAHYVTLPMLFTYGIIYCVYVLLSNLRMRFNY